MTTASKSALRVPYDLRPAKQVERRMFVDAFQRLAQAGFPIRDYAYTGMGSIFFYDFVIFHKLLGINKMTSFEHDVTLEGRLQFNSPFKSVVLRMQSAADVIPTLSRDQKHILWLDYDSPVTGEILNDVYLAGSQLSVGSVLLVTVDVEPPVKGSDLPRDTETYYKIEAGQYLGFTEPTAFAKRNLHKTSRAVMLNALKQGMAGRTGIVYCPLFYFIYADGHRMMTLGGMIGTHVENRQLQSLNRDGAHYLRTSRNPQPYEIRVPLFTRKERHLMDSAMPCDAGWQPADFKFPEKDIEAYRETYRFLPAYGEMLL